MSTRTEATEGQAKIRQALEQARAALGFDAYCLHCGTVTGDHKPHAHSAKGTGSSDESMDAEAFQGVRDLVGRLDEALSLLSPPIVGELTEEEIERITLKECPSIAHLPQGDHLPHLHGFQRGLRYARDHGYLAQAPQSSAPSVIEVGDAMENMMRRLRTQRDDEGILPTGNDFNGMDGLCAAWVAAKASRSSVTAPQGVTVDQILEVVNDWRENMHLIEVPPNTPYSTGVQNVLRSRLSALLTK